MHFLRVHNNKKSGKRGKIHEQKCPVCENTICLISESSAKYCPYCGLQIDSKSISLEKEKKSLAFLGLDWYDLGTLPIKPPDYKLVPMYNEREIESYLKCVVKEMHDELKQTIFKKAAFESTVDLNDYVIYHLLQITAKVRLECYKNGVYWIERERVRILFGSCHWVWRMEKRYLEEKDILWRTPAEKNPTTNFD